MRQTPDSPAAWTRLPRRDLYILPLLTLLTFVTLAATVEIICRVSWPEQAEDECLVPDLVSGPRPTPNCTAMIKTAEGPWVQDRWNDCGFRSERSCNGDRSRPVRVISLGTSTSWGEYVPLDQTWLARAEARLTQLCARGFDIQASGGLPNLYQIAARLPQIIRLHPDALILIVNPTDLAERVGGPFNPALVGQPLERVQRHPRTLTRLKDLFTLSRTYVVIEHLLYQDRSFFVSSYLQAGDRAGYLSVPFSAAWRNRLEFLDKALAHMATQLRSSGIPLLVILAPLEPQAELAGSAVPRPPNVDPFALGRAISEIAARHSMGFVDVTRSYIPIKSQSAFYAVDGHYNATGDEILGAAAAAALARVSRPAGGTLCGALPPIDVSTPTRSVRRN